MSLKMAARIGLVAVCVHFSTPVGAADGFTFKKVGVPKKSGGGRINIQITPEEDYYSNLRKQNKAAQDAEQTNAPATSDAKVAKAVPADLQNWFWETVSPSIAAAQSGRLDTALKGLAKHPARAAALAPNINSYQKLAKTHGTDILIATLGKKISPAFVLAVIGVESAGKADAVSGAGAVGLMQLIPATAERFDVTDSTDPKQNIKGGTAYLAWLLNEFSQDPLLALAGYNAGENAVKKHKGVPPYPETRAYVPKVVAAWQVARTLCMTPPKYVTDGCVFKTQANK